MNVALWIAQVLLMLVYLMTGSMKAFQPAKVRQNPQMTWAQDKSEGFIRFVGTSELLGALGMTLPMLTGILPWLTPLAGAGLALIQVLAIVTQHLPRKEFKILPMNVVLLALAVFVAVGRWHLLVF